jgi:sec-independent protein translocase protein TatA
MFGLGPLEILVIAAIAVMIYGKRLPEVGQTFGKTAGQLRKQWQAMSREFEMAATLDGQPAPRRVSTAAGRRSNDEGGPTVAAPRFEPPAAEDA